MTMPLGFMRRSQPVQPAIPGSALAILCVLGLGFPALGQLPKGFKPKDYVSDLANVLSEPAKAQINALCAEVEQKTEAQIAVVTVKSLEGRSIEDYSIDVAARLGVGPKKSNRGVMILLAVEDRRYRFEVGYGLEPILPDGKVGGFGREAIPYLRERNYDGALLLMTQRVAEAIAQDTGATLSTHLNIPPPTRTQDGGEGIPPGIIVGIVFLVLFFIIGALRSRNPTSRYARRHGGGWWIGPMIGGGWGGGGWGGGFGGGGGGFGGFGGGSFGGGGASGSW